MKKTVINTLITTAFIASLGFATTGAVAGPDLFQQQQLRQRVLESQQKLKQAEAAKGTEQQKLMDQMIGQMMEEHKVNMALATCDHVKK